MFMSLLGNVASAIIGTVAMPMAMLVWHLVFDFILGATFNPINVIASYVLMFWGSCFVELMTLQDLFGYSKKQLWIPILVGNFITYVLAAKYTSFPVKLPNL